MSWSDDDLNVALAEWRAEEPGSTAALEQRVLQAVNRRAWWRWAWAPALAAGLVVWALIPAEPAIAPPPLLARAPAAPGVLAPIPRRDRPRAHVGRGPSRLLPSPPSTEFVKLVTDDPDVVILWALDTEGDGK